MSRPLFMFRPNLQNEDHRRAWALLQAVPEGQKSAFLVQAILETVQKEELETILRRVLREELKSSSTLPCRALPAGESTQAPGETIPQEMMGFLDSLMDED